MVGLFASSLMGCHSTDEFVAAIRSWPELWKENLRLLEKHRSESSRNNGNSLAGSLDSVVSDPSSEA